MDTTTQDIFIIIILGILFYYFNCYFINIVTDQKSKPTTYICYSSKDPKSKEECELRYKYDFNRTIGLLTIGTIQTIGSLYIDNKHIKYSLLFASIMTISHGLAIGWYDYNDITKLCIIIVSIIAILYNVRSKLNIST